METNWAADHLQTIRTLMERSAVYRRALGPIMLAAGIIGSLAAIGGISGRLESPKAFLSLWFGAAALTIIAALLLVRRQAIKDAEPFWSPPTRRVTQALVPPLLCGMVLSLFLILIDSNWFMNSPIAVIWLLFYGCALNSAGFFMTRGIKLFGWGIIIGTIVLVLVSYLTNSSPRPWTAHAIMGFFFGVLHLAYGVYLFLTEKGKNAA